jgi:hypothetical protein
MSFTKRDESKIQVHKMEYLEGGMKIKKQGSRVIIHKNRMI